MPLVSFDAGSAVVAGVKVEGGVVALADLGLPATMRQFLALSDGIKKLRAAIKGGKVRPRPMEGLKLRTPVPDPQKITCIGLNYKRHAAESNLPIPPEPVGFNKYTTALRGDGESIVIPPVSQEVDYECELVIVIGKLGRNIPEDEAMNYVFGFTCGNDVSARDWQRKPGGQWMLGKTFDTFGPVGPWIVAADKVDAQNLRIQTRVNGQTLQDSNTSDMIFHIPKIVSYVSQVFTLEPGDLIFTGTPEGVGFARKPPIFLKEGDVVEIEIEDIGVLRNPVVQG